MNTGLDAAVLEEVRYRGIMEVLHFTTSRGLLGIFASQAILCRDQLPENEHIEYIYTPNCADRLKDREWTGYVNLSISHVNQAMLDSSNRWHPPSDELWWIILSFHPQILAAPGVYFATTNNTYPPVRRGEGGAGLRALFADRIPWGYYGGIHVRQPAAPKDSPTDPQAEVLYPSRLPVADLQVIYVLKPEHADWARSVIELLPFAPNVPVIHRPEAFQ